jgi:CubicO group peptidase (beta-lactamase class C family)
MAAGAYRFERPIDACDLAPGLENTPQRRVSLESSERNFLSLPQMGGIKKTRLRNVSLAAFLSILWCCQAPPTTEAPEKATVTYDFDGARSVLQDAVDNNILAGAIGLVARDDEILFQETIGMADREAGKPMEMDTIFRIASMTKPVTSVAAMMLYEEGHFELDDPVSKFIPDFKNMRVLQSRDADARDTVPAKNAMTVRDLMTHTSGLTYRFLGVEPLATIYAEAGISDALSQTDVTLEEQVKRLAGLPLLHEPGEEWHYGLSTDVLGHLVEVLSGKNLDGFLRERIFVPLGMKDTCFFLPEEKLPRLSAVYWNAGDGTLKRLGEEPVEDDHLIFSSSSHYSGPRIYFSGGGGLVSTTYDYHRFARMLLNRGELEGVRLLEAGTVDMMTRNQIGDLNHFYDGKFGLGFAVQTEPGVLGPPGSLAWGGVFHTAFSIYPEKELVILFMSQHAPGFDLAIHIDFVSAVYDSILEQEIPET